ncbi:MAG: hypothetical protein SFU86_16875 [Pirellulaceae bacterium]|nr:hypothetical protein [Pirellulaceae bacterium]
MAVVELKVPSRAALPLDGSVSARSPMYAIAFDMDIESLRHHYGDPYNNAYLEIRKIL